jgi:glucose/arabinose dehydrogenase
MQMDSVGIEKIADGFVSPLGLVHDSENDHMFVFDQVGIVALIKTDGSVVNRSFLDLQDQIVELKDRYDERGFLGMALHPEFKENRRFFVYYSAPLRKGAPKDWDHTGIVSEFTVQKDHPEEADRNSERIILEIHQPQTNHNGGHIAFGPDGCLYIPLGDGGAGNDVGTGHPEIGNGQDISTLLGSILRINVDDGDPYSIPADNPFADSDDGRDEIFAYGFRNPYHISFDREGERELFAADVGQDLWEEVNIVTLGGNYGWNIREGMHCFNPENSTEPLDEN